MPSSEGKWGDDGDAELADNDVYLAESMARGAGASPTTATTTVWWKLERSVGTKWQEVVVVGNNACSDFCGNLPNV